MRTYRPHRHSHPLLRHARVSHAPQNRGDEIRHRRRPILQDKYQNKQVQPSITHSSQHTLRSAELPLGRIRLGAIMHHPCHSQGTLLLAEATTGRMRVVGQDKRGAQGKRHGHDALDNKQPPPTRTTKGPVEAGHDSTGNETRRCAREANGRVEEGPALANLAALVPRRHDVQHAGGEAGLDQREEDAAHNGVGVRPHLAHDDDEGAPGRGGS